MKIATLLMSIIPWAGSPARFRICIHLREFYRTHKLFFLAKCLKAYMQNRYGCEIAVHAIVSPKVSFMHTVGVIIGEGVIVESNVTIYGNVCLGRKNIEDDTDYPIIKSGAKLHNGCSVLGRVVVEENAIIGAHALVLSNCVENGVYAGCPAKLIKVLEDESKNS